MVVYGCIWLYHRVASTFPRENFEMESGGGLTNWLSSQRDRFDRYLMFETGTVGVCFF